MWKIIIIFICLGILFYALYMQGLLVINSKRAVMFMGSIRGKTNCKARLDADKKTKILSGFSV